MPRLSSAHAIAAVALFAALGGGAYAAATIGSKDIKRSAVRSKHLKNGQVRSVDLSRAVRLQLQRTGTGQGPKGDRGPRGRRGRTGPTGPTGPAGTFTTTLPEGQTLRGTYVYPEGETAISFGVSLAGAPAGHWLAEGDAPTVECPGTAQAPAAAPGHLCVYEADAEGALTERRIANPSLDGAPEGAAAFGAMLRATGSGQSRGSWAVTAG